MKRELNIFFLLSGRYSYKNTLYEDFSKMTYVYLILLSLIIR